MTTGTRSTTPAARTRPRPNGHAPPAGTDGGEGLTDQLGHVAEQARESVSIARRTLGHYARQGQDETMRSLRLWAALVVRCTPLVLLGDRVVPRTEWDRDSDTLPTIAWADGMFTMIETALTAERRCVDEVLATQRRLVTRMLDPIGGSDIAPEPEVGVVSVGVRSIDDCHR